MKEEKDLLARCGKENPFKTPEGYFEHFHEEMISHLPKPEAAAPRQVSLMERIKPLLYMAAMFASTVFLIQGLMFVQEKRFSTPQVAAIEEIYTDEIDHFMSTSLYNEYALYSYLTTGENY